MSVYKELEGKVAVITGAAGGLGIAAAEAFLSQGCKVALIDLSEKALELATEKLGSNKNIITIIADVASEEDVKNYVAITIKTWGTIDIFFNNAGIEGKIADITEQKMDDVDRVFAVNIRGTYLGLKYVLPVMYEKKTGTVINTSSVGGLTAGPGLGLTPYVTSKFAITGLTRICANESAKYNVRVNSIHPSPVNTEMMRRIESGLSPCAADEVKSAITRNIPLGRYADANDIAKTVLFLSSDASAFITGAQLRVDGGQLN